jgi:peroxiredoxin
MTGRRLLGQVHASLEKWEALLEECQSGVLQDGEADAQFWQGIALVRLGRSEEAKVVLEAMKESLKKALASGGSSDTMKSLARTLRSEIAMTHEVETESWLPAVDRARVLFKAGRKGEALALMNTGHFLETATYCDLHFAAGDQKKALFAFGESFQSKASMADAMLPVFGRLQGIAKTLNLSPKWQRSRPEWTARFALPELKAPSTAHPWELPNQEGTLTTLDTYKGKPVVLNFFLGVSCPYCRLQLDKFRPQLDAFRAAEIAFVGITTDELSLVKQATSAAPEIFPFPIYCDPMQKVFRDYDIFDDFENFPMHGTVVLNAEGRIIWRNVGHAPFGDPKALLMEIQRLLKGKS